MTAILFETMVETAKPQAERAKGSKDSTMKDSTIKPPTIDDPLGAGDAERFKGQPVVLFARLERAMSELAFYKASLRHRNESETSDARSHEQWRRAAVALAHELADEIEVGLLEPNGEIKRKLDMAQALIDDAMKAQRGA